MDKLMPLVDTELKKIAHNYMRNERAGHILQTTALINEALIKLIKENISWENRKQFRSEEHTSELQSLMRISYAVFCLKKKKKKINYDQIPMSYRTKINT